MFGCQRDNEDRNKREEKLDWKFYMVWMKRKVGREKLIKMKK
jgi:hypothetical protein